MTRSTTLRPGLVLAAALGALALGGCNKKPETQAQAGGEILEGSVSDAMLPLDTATSQPPLAPKAVTSGDKVSGEDAEADKPDADKAEPAEPAPKAPAAEPE